MKMYMGLEGVGKISCTNVLNVIREKKEISRKEISSITGLSWATMTKIINKLFEKGYIEETKTDILAGVGQNSGLISICKESNVVIGLDVNREGLSGCVLNLAGDIMKEYKSEIACANKAELIQTIISFTSQVVKENNKRNILAIGVAMQGIVDAERGISNIFPGCDGWEHVPIREILVNHFQYPVYIEHDPNCMLYSAIYNNPKENCILFRIDRSIGMAAIIEGKILRGNGLLEVAHTICIPDGKECKCGRRGCAEAYLESCLVNKELQAKEIPSMVRAISVLMYNMSEVFNAEKIILAGELATFKNEFEEQILESFNALEKEGRVKVEFMEEVERVVYGAAMIAAQGVIEKIEV